MRDRLGDLSTVSLSINPSHIYADRLAQQEALSALVALGYKPPEASRVLSQIPSIEALNSEAIIRAALKQLMR